MWHVAITFLCQGVSCVLAMVVVFRRIQRLQIQNKVVLFSWNMLGKGSHGSPSPASCGKSFVSVGNIILQSVINTFGASTRHCRLLCNRQAEQHGHHFLYPLGNGISSYTSQNMGAGKMDRVHKGFSAGRNLVCGSSACLHHAPVLLLRPLLLLLFMNDPQGPAIISPGMLFLRILSPFYFCSWCRSSWSHDGILPSCGRDGTFMIATFSDLILRVGIAIVLSSTALGSTGIWMAWPVGWCIGTGLSLVFYFTAIRKGLAESPAKAETQRAKLPRARAEAEFAADAEMETLLTLCNL